MGSTDWGRKEPKQMSKGWENFWTTILSIIVAGIIGAIVVGFGTLFIESEKEDNKRYDAQCSQIVKLAEGRDMKRDDMKCYFIKNDKLEAVEL